MTDKIKELTDRCSKLIQDVKFAQAAECAQELIGLKAELYGERSPEMLDAYGSAALAYSLNAYHTAGHAELGEERFITSDRHFALSLYYYNEALEITKEHCGENSTQAARIYSNMGSVYRLMDDDWQEEEYYMQAIAIYCSLVNEVIEKHGEFSEEIADIYENLSMLYKNLDCTKEMLMYIEKAEAVYDKLDGECGHDHDHEHDHDHCHCTE